MGFGLEISVEAKGDDAGRHPQPRQSPWGSGIQPAILCNSIGFHDIR